MDFDVTTLHGRRADQRWNRMVVGDMFERLTWSTPDKEALVGWTGAYATEDFHRLTYREADAAANRVARALRAGGLEEGDRVLLYCENSVEAVVTMFGIAKAGLVAVPVNPNLAPDVLAWVVEHVNVRFTVIDGEFGQRTRDVFATAGLNIDVTIPIGGPVAPGSRAFADWIAEQPNEELPGTRHADDVWSILFTSGTTSMPKASMTTHTYSYMAGFAYAMSVTRGLEYEGDLKMCTFLPVLYHCGHNASVLPAILAGGTMVLGRRASAPALADAVTAEKVTAVWAGSPAWVQQLTAHSLDHDDVDLTSLTVVMFAWGAMNPDMARNVEKACGPQVKMLEVFGQTEAMSCYRFWPDQYPEKFEESLAGTNYVGVPNPLLAADIIDADGNSLRGRPGIPGEAVYRSPIVTAGYYGDVEATREAFRDGWFHSGDSCMYDEDGQQIMVDRFKDIVKSGGENVSSLRVESVLVTHPDVLRAAVIGVPDDRLGEKVIGVVTLDPGRRPDINEIRAFARARLAGYESPKEIVVVDRMPETVGGKIMKYKLRKRFTSNS
ncbi:class I adenylate-forming enzyme family protein [Prescottella agglutinans]|uniref:Acyl-CoA synthetase (AMP-forming)/AMP-acid ligase II n=1 Tax=Prescottella agglutinans TaxID=1644129 RepID=A0ABT6MK35_9NOCA|nr:class I adenylate-forming enzyme family protein [Prescottella agglutinans]MDH6284686.1 acyl-CoA synthetase (AMP-forming)/AMP-acid ligase II [Prescottella agglutinans]